MLTSEQVRAARAMLRMDRAELAEAAGVSIQTVRRLEAQDGPLLIGRTASVDAIEKVLLNAGVEFLNGESPGVCLRRNLRAAALAPA